MRKILLLTLPILMFWACGETEDTGKINKPKVDYAARAKELYDFIEKNYRITAGTHEGMMNENSPKAIHDSSCAFLWPYDWYMSAVTLMDDLGFDVDYEYGIENFQRYWQPDGNGIHGSNGIEYTTPGYSSGSGGAINSGNKTGDRYYDDNAWVAGNLVDAYSKTKKDIYLQRAKAVIDFIYTGLDNEQGGGVWWNEAQSDPTNGRRYKPICTNGPFAVALLKYYKENPVKDAQILADGKATHNWMCSVLRDQDYLFWGDIDEQGAINKAKDPAITGMVIQSGVLLYQITGEQQYLDDAIISADAAFKHFVSYIDGVMQYSSYYSASNIKLFRAYLALQPYYSKSEQYINIFTKYLDWIYDNKRNSEGYFPQYTQGSDPGSVSWLITQSWYLEGYAASALFIRDGKVRN